MTIEQRFASLLDELEDFAKQRDAPAVETLTSKARNALVQDLKLRRSQAERPVRQSKTPLQALCLAPANLPWAPGCSEH